MLNELKKIDFRTSAMALALLGIWITFAVLSESFLSPRNLSNLFLQTSVTAILAIGMVLVIVAGHIDLSIGSLVGLAGGIAAALQVWHGWPTWLVIPTVLLVGALIGWFQGFWVAFLGVPAFIVTLGGMMVMRGSLMGLARGTTIAPMDPSFAWFGKAYLAPSLSWGLALLVLFAFLYAQFQKRRQRLEYGLSVLPLPLEAGKLAGVAGLLLLLTGTLGQYRGLPVPLLLVGLLALLIHFLARHTPFGRHVFAIGGNLEAAKLSGIPVRKRVMALFALNGALGAVAAMVLTARVNAATISAGQTYELDAIAACVIGGTSLMGGAGSIPGALIGALVMASLDNGMSLLNLETFWQYVVKGAILVLAVSFDIYSRRERKA